MMTGPRGPAGQGRDRLRAGHADRERTIAVLKDAFVHGRLTRDELDARAGRAFSARTYADLAALTADIPAADIPAAGIPPARIPAGPAPVGSVRPPAPVQPPVPARRRPLARAAAGSGVCLVIVAAAIGVGAHLDPGGLGPNSYHSWAKLCLFVALAALITAIGILLNGVGTAVEQRHSRKQLPLPRPGITS
jgi:hypothetical protein